MAVQVQRRTPYVILLSGYGSAYEPKTFYYRSLIPQDLITLFMSWIKPPAFRTFLLKGPMLLFLLLAGIFSARAADPKKGETLFKNNCTSCHALDYKVVGPALKGITGLQTEDWLVKWIINNNKFRATGDKAANAIYTEYNGAAMSVFEGILSTDDIKDILAYIKDASAAPKVSTASATGAAVAAGPAADTASSGWLTLSGLVVVIIVLFLVIGIMNRVISTLEKLLLRFKGGPVATEESPYIIVDEVPALSAPKVDRLAGLKRLSTNKQAVVLVLLLTVVSMTVAGWDQMLTIGITQGYQPVQPINYSHQLHAGALKIACQYCHSGAWKSKNAGIPSANICMNCHAAVQLREKYNGKVSPELSKIYKALDFDPDSKKYGPNKKPIQWVKIHQLQDFVYFNHSQHVKVGGVSCQKCHGQIQEMKQVYQASALTMGWCINCHRVTKVNSKGNGYYDKMLAMHDEFKKGQKVTVAMMGGIECAKCHY